MKASRPQDLPSLFLRAMNAGDVESVVSLYEPDGVIAADPGQVVSGHASIRSMVTTFLAQWPRFVLHDVEVVEAGHVALVRSRWTVSKPEPSGTTTEMKVSPTLVARRQSDGSWLVVIDRPLPVG